MDNFIDNFFYVCKLDETFKVIFTLPASFLFLKPIWIHYSKGPLVHFLFYDSKVFGLALHLQFVSLCNFFVLLILWSAGRTIYKRVNQRSRRTSCLLAKGRIISEQICGVFKFSKKATKYCLASKMGQIKNSKGNFLYQIINYH